MARHREPECPLPNRGKTVRSVPVATQTVSSYSEQGEQCFITVVHMGAGGLAAELQKDRIEQLAVAKGNMNAQAAAAL